MMITSAKELGKILREKRKQEGFTQEVLAGLCNVGNRFISDIENGKETAQIGKVMTVIHMLGLKLTIESRV